MSKTVITPLGTVSPYPKGDKNCPGFLIQQDGYNILLDCGNGCTRLLGEKEKLNNLKVFISHLHPDHYGDLVSLLQTLHVYKKYGYIKQKAEIYLPETKSWQDEYYTASDGWYTSRKVEKHAMDYELIQKYSGREEVDLHGYSKNLKTNFGNVKITNLWVPHDIESYALKVETPNGTIVYSGDTGTKNGLRTFAKDCDLFICESTFLRGQYRDKDEHLFAHEAAEIAKDANVKKLVLTHFWPEIEKENYLRDAQEIFANTEVAEEGKQLVLGR